MQSHRLDHAGRAARRVADDARRDNLPRARKVGMPVGIVAPMHGHAQIAAAARAVGAARVEGEVHLERRDRPVGLHRRRPLADHRWAAAPARHVVGPLRMDRHRPFYLGRRDGGDNRGGQMRVELAAKGAARAPDAHVDTRGAQAESGRHAHLRAARVLTSRPDDPPAVLLWHRKRRLCLHEKVLLPAAGKGALEKLRRGGGGAPDVRRAARHDAVVHSATLGIFLGGAFAGGILAAHTATGHRPPGLRSGGGKGRRRQA